MYAEDTYMLQVRALKPLPPSGVHYLQVVMRCDGGTKGSSLGGCVKKRKTSTNVQILAQKLSTKVQILTGVAALLWSSGAAVTTSASSTAMSRTGMAVGMRSMLVAHA